MEMAMDDVKLVAMGERHEGRLDAKIQRPFAQRRSRPGSNPAACQAHAPPFAIPGVRIDRRNPNFMPKLDLSLRNGEGGAHNAARPFN
jgi:hypothetical protein